MAGVLLNIKILENAITKANTEKEVFEFFSIRMSAFNRERKE